MAGDVQCFELADGAGVELCLQRPEVRIEAAIERLGTMGYLDDAAFARYWVQNRNEFKPLSPKALRYELRQKGVPADIIDETLESLEASDLAYRAAQARVSKLRGTDKKMFRQKLSAFLKQRGFNYTTTREVVERLIEELEAQDPDYFGDEHD